MFGYVRIYKPELKMMEYEQYQGIYCGLCRQLGKRYGILARAALSYDMTFLALLRTALDRDGECPRFAKTRCVCNPFKKCTFCGQSEHVDAAADITALLMYHKLRDSISDDGFFSSLPARIALPFVSLARRRAARRMPEADERICACMSQQSEIERSGNATVDSAAHPFALLLSYIACLTAHSDAERRALDRFGYCLGRWIYLMDAADDLTADVKKGRFNPFKSKTVLSAEELAEIRAAAVFSLNACLAECITAYNLLEIGRFDGILRNILEYGLPNVQKIQLQPKGRL